MAAKIPFLQSVKSRNKIYYRYLMPDGSFESLGTDQSSAARKARALNKIREERAKKTKAPVGQSKRNMLELLDVYEPVKMRSSKSDKTKEEWARHFRRYREWMGNWSIAKVTVLNLDTLLEDKAPRHESYRKHRILLGEIFTYAIGKGWRQEQDGNPGKALLPPKLAREKHAKSRTRLSKSQFDAIYAVADPWLQIAMDMSYQLGIRRTDLSQLQLSNFKDGYLSFIPSKTSDLPDPAALKFKIGPKLKALRQRSFELKPVSHYFLSKQNYNTSETRGDRNRVTPEQISRHFAKARAKADQELFEHLTPAQLPTFHEIRSLCARTYLHQGRENSEIQLILGHATKEMTEEYLATGEVQWTEIMAEIG